jgi:Lrp/AsnC family transcriptional regulator, leucine-responsive regulatory protein
MQQAPEVMQCFYVTGASDFVLLLTADDMAHYEEFTQRYFFQKSVRRFGSLAVMTRVKFGTAIPLAAKADRPAITLAAFGSGR